MNKENVTAFFDSMAANWDTMCNHDVTRINTILDYAGISNNCSVLDVACGTGILFEHYLARDVKSIVGVDISSCMIAQAAKKFTDPRITLITGDVEQVSLGKYDCCVIYSAFPHFEDPSRLIETLSKHLTADGRLTIAHSESKGKINHRHTNSAAAVSVDLMPAYELAQLFAPHLNVDVMVDNDEMYIVSGIKSK